METELRWSCYILVDTQLRYIVALTTVIEMRNKPQRKTFTREFKLDVIQQSYHRENIRELATELGIQPALIYKWRSRYQASPQQSFPGRGVEALTPEEQKLHALQKENAQLRMERDILKKAIAIFSRGDGPYAGSQVYLWQPKDSCRAAQKR